MPCVAVAGRLSALLPQVQGYTLMAGVRAGQSRTTASAMRGVRLCVAISYQPRDVLPERTLPLDCQLTIGRCNNPAWIF